MFAEDTGLPQPETSCTNMEQYSFYNIHNTINKIPIAQVTVFNTVESTIFKHYVATRYIIGNVSSR
jgi:hypothetical protein